MRPLMVEQTCCYSLAFHVQCVTKHSCREVLSRYQDRGEGEDANDSKAIQAKSDAKGEVP